MKKAVNEFANRVKKNKQMNIYWPLPKFTILGQSRETNTETKM